MATSSTVNLILTTLRFSLDTIDKEELEFSCKQEINWDIYNSLIQYHKLGSIIHDKTNHSMDQIFPIRTRNMLKQAHIINTAANLLLSEKIVEIFDTFESKKIKVLLIKGQSIENWIYSKPGLRSSGDIDLFITLEDFFQALECLESLGYELANLSGRLESKNRLYNQFTRTQKDCVFIHKTSNVIVELHWRLALKHSTFPLNFDTCWKEKDEFAIRGKSIWSLPHVMHAVYLCYHGANHSWQHLFWLYDIAILMLNKKTNWNKILAQAQKLKAETTLGLALILTSKVFLIPIPQSAHQDDETIKKGELLSNGIYDKILADIPHWPSPDEITLAYIRQSLSWQSLTHPSKDLPPDWFGYLITPGMNDWKSLRLPDSLTPLYRVWRPIRLILTGLSKLKSKKLRS